MVCSCTTPDETALTEVAKSHLTSNGFSDSELLMYEIQRELGNWQVRVTPSDEWLRLHPDEANLSWPLAIEINDRNQVTSFQ